MIRTARESEAEIISELAIRSKSHWKYTADQLEVFRGELTISGEQLVAKRAHVAEELGIILGFYTLTTIDDHQTELEHIFVDPDHLSRGIGSRLFRHGCGTARAYGATVLVIQSDPNAAGFYLALGATLKGELPSSIPGRTIPLFNYSLLQSGTI